jgi:hypothetical protein
MASTIFVVIRPVIVLRLTVVVGDIYRSIVVIKSFMRPKPITQIRWPVVYLPQKKTKSGNTRGKWFVASKAVVFLCPKMGMKLSVQQHRQRTRQRNPLHHYPRRLSETAFF